MSSSPLAIQEIISDEYEAVRKGLAQADRGEYVDSDELKRRYNVGG